MITAVTTCMGRLEHLEMTLPCMLEEFDRVIVVDWSCPQKSGNWANSQGASVVYSLGHKTFNAAKARNLGAKSVQTEYVCFIDADTYVLPNFRDQLKPLLARKSMIIAPRNATNHDVLNLGGFIVCHIKDFWEIGGYDESFNGFAHEDADLRVRLCLDAGVKARRPIDGLATIRHSDEMRGRYFDEPIHVSSARNFHLVKDKLKIRGVDNWVTDPRTADIAYRIAGHHD